VLGRFLAEDPIRDGLNWYAYAGNNPLFYLDPFGLYEVSIRDFVGWYGGSVSANDYTRVSTFTINGVSLYVGYSGANDYGINIENVNKSLIAKDHTQLYSYFSKALGIPSIQEEALREDLLGDALTLVLSVGLVMGGEAIIGAVSTSPAAATIGGSGAAAVSRMLSNVEPNRITHIMQTKHAWDLVGVNNWNAASNVINIVLTKGQGVVNSAGNMVYNYVFSGQTIEVTTRIIDGVERIVDAWVKTL
jgi:hypothetical protein